MSLKWIDLTFVWNLHVPNQVVLLFEKYLFFDHFGENWQDNETTCWMPINLGLHQEFSDLCLENSVIYFGAEIFAIFFEEIFETHSFIDEKALFGPFDFYNRFDGSLHFTELLLSQTLKILRIINSFIVMNNLIRAHVFKHLLLF